MDRFKALGTGARAALLAGGVVIVAAAGYGVWSVNQPVTSVPVVAKDIPAPEAPSNPAPASNTAPAADQIAAKAPEPAEAATDKAMPPTAEATPVEPELQEVLPAAPTFDLVRVEPDGQALVAGQAEPGAKVILRLDGAEISGTTADPQGNFAVLFVLDPSPVPRMLTLGSILPGGGEIAALGEVALAPTAAAPAASAAKGAAAAPKSAAAPSSAASDVAAGLSAEAAPPTAPATALLVTKDGVNVLQSSDQSVTEGDITPLSLDTISYTPAGDVQLAGRAPAGSVLRIYLDNAPLIDVAVGQDGRWASTTPMIDPGLYTLRVDALAADGKVSARFETPFKRESPDALAAATQSEAPEAVTEAPAAGPPASDAQIATSSEAAKVAPTANKTAAVADPIPPADLTNAPQNAVAENPAPKNPVSITVQPGFTLWGIATDQFGDGVLYVQVFEANKDKIRDPDLIYPGQVFVIPAGSE